MLPKGWKWLLLVVLLGAYANHFDNSFHFDDSHTIIDNPAIREPGQVWRFFTDGSRFSVLPTNQGWRPLLSTTLTFDYWLAGGLKPWAFHLDTFVLFLLHIAAVYALYAKALPSKGWAAFGCAVFALHPVMAETVNYMIQRGDLLASLGCTAGLALYAYGSRFYWLGFLAAALGKPNGVVFPMLLTGWMWFIERRWRWWSWIFCGFLGLGLALLHRHLTPPSYNPGGASARAYWWTQPYVICTYVVQLFWPTGLVADTDLGLFASPWEPAAVAGYVGVGALLLLGLWASRSPRTRPITFGLLWFFSALLPTALIPLAEVTNDHRMFFAYVGLILAAVHSLSLLPITWLSRLRFMAPVLLLALALATYGRNQVWHSEETLWREVTQKAPNNGRGWMNYGLTQMGRADYNGARVSFQNAARLSPNYSLVYVNQGILEAATGRAKEASEAFARARQLAPGRPDGYYYEARWLQNSQPVQALELLEQALKVQRDYPQAQQLLLDLGLRQRDWVRLKRWQNSFHPTLSADSKLKQGQELELKEALAQPQSVARYVQLGFVYHRQDRFAEALKTAQAGLQRFPGDALLLNNEAAALLALERWPEAARSAELALKLRPDWQLARNNLNYALAKQKAGR